MSIYLGRRTRNRLQGPILPILGSGICIYLQWKFLDFLLDLWCSTTYNKCMLFGEIQSTISIRSTLMLKGLPIFSIAYLEIKSLFQDAKIMYNTCRRTVNVLKYDSTLQRRFLSIQWQRSCNSARDVLRRRCRWSCTSPMGFARLS